MKKNKIFAIIAILAITISGVLVFQACKKNSILKNGNNNESTTFTSSTGDIEDYLLNLRKRMKTASKDGETITLSDAEWSLSALENFGFCDGSKWADEMIVDTFYTEINVSGNNVFLYDLNLVYESNKKHILDKFNSLDGDDKSIYLINCHIGEPAKNGTAVVTIITNMRNGGLTAGNLMRFGPTDYWAKGFGWGKCATYWEPQYLGRDATTEMQCKVMANKGNYNCENGRIFFSDTQEYSEESFDYGEDCYDGPFSPYCMYADNNDCLSPEELNWCLDKIIERVNGWEHEFGRPMIGIHIACDFYTGTKSDLFSPDSGLSFWIMTYTFGTINCTQQPFDL